MEQTESEGPAAIIKKQEQSEGSAVGTDDVKQRESEGPDDVGAVKQSQADGPSVVTENQSDRAAITAEENQVQPNGPPIVAEQTESHGSAVLSVSRSGEDSISKQSSRGKGDSKGVTTQYMCL